MFAANAEAATYTVTNTNASGPGSLPAAITSANTDNTADTITFAAGLTGTITLTSQLNITDAGGLTIQGPGASTLSVSGGGASGIFAINASGGPSVSISGLTLTDGSSSNPGGAIEDESSPLTLTDDVITGNTSTQLGGGVFVNNEGSSSLSVSGSTISDNSAYAGGGIFGFAPVVINGSNITGNPASGTSGGPVDGGGIASLGGLTVTGSTVSGNTATGQGGGIDAKYKTTIIENSTISGNSAPNGAALSASRIETSSPVTVTASTISGNQGGANSFGGGILLSGELDSPFDLVDSTITGNSATDGGGVSLSYGGSTAQLIGTGGSIAFDNSTIDGNNANGKGGGIYLAAQDGGATAAVNSTIVANNTASDAPNDLYQGVTTSGGIDDTFSLIENPGNAKLLSSQALITGVDPQLNPLANNGGSTETMLPKATSPVIDQGKAQPGLTADQRGDPRTVDNGKARPAGGDGTDIGAVELAKIPPPPPPAPPPPPPAAKTISATVDPATGITNTSATLNGTIDTDGEAVTWHFEYGTTTGASDARAGRSGDPVTPTESISAGHGNVPASFKVSGLKPGTRYAFHVVAVSSSGQTVTSSDDTFTTTKPTLKLNPGAVRAAQAVRLFGSAGACTRGSRVALISSVFSPAHKYHGHNAVYARVGQGFRFSVVAQIPAGRDPGRYAITARCDGAAFGVTAFLQVLPPPPAVRFTG